MGGRGIGRQADREQSVCAVQAGSYQASGSRDATEEAAEAWDRRAGGRGSPSDEGTERSGIRRGEWHIRQSHRQPRP